MIYSMTAFAREQNQIDSAVICWEIKSVNHRYLEAGFRLPEQFRFLETNLRTVLREHVSRGKLECQLKVTFAPDSKVSMSLNQSLVNGLLEAGQAISLSHQLADDLTVSKVLSWPGVAELMQPDQESMSQQVEDLFVQTLEQLVSARNNEGQKLKEFILTRLKALSSEVETTRHLVKQISSQTREKLLSRLEGLQLTVAEPRVEQEIALMLAKLDVSEEMDRLQAHIHEVEQVLEKRSAVGRRLDFLMQELNREANTLSSKSDSSELTRHAVEMKVLIEQMREQIQNIE